MAKFRPKGWAPVALGAVVAAWVLWLDAPARADKVLIADVEEVEVIAPVPIRAKAFIGKAAKDEGDTGTGGPDLVKYRPEIRADIEQAERFIAGKEYDKALAVYLELMKEEAGAVMPLRGEGGNERVFVGILDEIQRRIGRLPPAGLQRYRAEVDPQAGRLMERGRNGDLPALLELVDRYRHSSFGAEAVELAAARLFDRTSFAQAARLWELWLRELSADRPGRATILLRLATAYQYLGRSEQAARILKLFRDDAELNRADIVIAGRRTPTAVYLENVLREPPTITTSRPTWFGGADDWPGPMGNPSGSRPTADAEVVLHPHWAGAAVVDTEERDPAPRVTRRFYGNQYEAGPAEPERPVPAVVDGRVLIQFSSGLHAFSMATGRLLYHPRSDEVNTAKDGSERGRLYVTAAEGLVFTVDRFPAFSTQMVRFGGASGRSSTPTGNRLTARNAKTGEIIWQTGRTRSEDDEELPRSDLQKMVDSAVILTAPTYSAGRLYAVAVLGEAYHGLCLDAATGRPVWTKYLSHRPLTGNTALLGSPAAVSAGVVYCLTNAGTLGAFDETTGQVIWIFQYADAARVRSYGTPVYPPNALCVAGDRLYFLPSDSDRLYCIRAGTGELVWHAERGGAAGAGLPWLAGAGRRTVEGKTSEVVALVGREVKLYSAAGGKLLASVDLAEQPGMTVRSVGRPALSGSAVYVSVADRGIARVALDDGKTSWSRLPADYRRDPVPLGTLLPLSGRIVVCDRATTAAYAPFRETFRAGEDPTTVEGRLRRGLLAVGAGEFVRARADFTAALTMAEGGDAPASLVAEARQRLYQSLFASAAHETTAEARRAMLEQAAGSARSARERIESRLHLARTLVELRQFSPALDAAQSIIDGFGPNPIDAAELRIAVSRTAAAADLTDSREAAQTLVADIVGLDRSAYAKWDAKAEELFARATAADPSERIAQLRIIRSSYPHAAVIDRVLVRMALDTAAEAAGIAAVTGAGPAALHEAEWSALRARARAMGLFARVVRERPNSTQRATALAHLTMLDSLLPDSGEYGRRCLALLAELPGDAPLEYPSGRATTVRAFLDRYGGGLPTAEFPADIPLNRMPVRLLGAPGSRLLRGTDGRPLVYDGKLLVVTTEALELRDPTADGPTWRSAAVRAPVRQTVPGAGVGRGGGFNVRGVVRPAVFVGPGAARVVRPPSSVAADGESAALYSVGGIASFDDNGVKRDVLAIWDGRRIVTVDLKSGRMLWVSEDNLFGDRPAADFYNGVFALVSRVGTAGAGEPVLVNALRRRVVRPTLLSPVLNQTPPIAGPAGAAFAADGKFGVDFVEPARGEAVFRLPTDSFAHAIMRSTCGSVLYMSSGRIVAADADGWTLWSFGDRRGRSVVRALHHDAEFVALQTYRNNRPDGAPAGELTVLSTETGRVLWSAPLDAAPEGANVLWAARAGDRLHTLVSAVAAPGNPAAWGLECPGATAVVAYDLRGAGKPAWAHALPAVMSNRVISCPLTTRTQLVLHIREGHGHEGRLLRLSRETGKVVAEDRFVGSAAPETAAGTLIADSFDGVRLYGTAGPVWRAVDRILRKVEQIADELVEGSSE